MTIKSLTLAALTATSMFLAPSGSSAAVIFADTVIDFFDSGAGPLTGPYGGTFPGASPVPVPLTHATDGDSSTFVSLPTGSFITLGFSSGFVFDGTGADIFISEVGGVDENANIFVSSDFGSTFEFLGVATTGTVSGFDLASIGFSENVNALKVEGLDNGGGSPGFDIAFAQGLEGSSVITAPVPEPSSIVLLGAGLFGLRLARRKRGLRFQH